MRYCNEYIIIYIYRSVCYCNEYIIIYIGLCVIVLIIINYRVLLIIN